MKFRLIITYEFDKHINHYKDFKSLDLLNDYILKQIKDGKHLVNNKDGTIWNITDWCIYDWEKTAG